MSVKLIDLQINNLTFFTKRCVLAISEVNSAWNMLANFIESMKPVLDKITNPDELKLRHLKIITANMKSLKEKLAFHKKNLSMSSIDAHFLPKSLGSLANLENNYIYLPNKLAHAYMQKNAHTVLPTN